jgi:hypothetical protein
MRTIAIGNVTENGGEQSFAKLKWGEWPKAGSGRMFPAHLVLPGNKGAYVRGKNWSCQACGQVSLQELRSASREVEVKPGGSALEASDVSAAWSCMANKGGGQRRGDTRAVHMKGKKGTAWSCVPSIHV